MMARSTNAPSKGRIQKRKTTLHLFKSGLQRTAGPYKGAMSRQRNAGQLTSSMGSRENSDVQLARACNGTTSVKWVPPVDSCLVNSAPS
jgi:hypothetical protein